MVEQSFKKAVIYCRVSSEDQAQHGISLDAQEITCREYAEQEGYSVTEVIKDEGISGKSIEGRKGIKKILWLATNKMVDAVLMVHSDRLSRRTKDHIDMMDLFDQSSVRVIFPYQPTMDRRTAIGYSMDSMNAIMNEYVSRTTSEKTRGAILAKIKEGWFPGRAPIGYINVENPKYKNGEISKRIIVPDPEKAKIVAEAFQMYATGRYNALEVNDAMYEKGLRAKYGHKIHPSIFYDLLANPLYVGELWWGDARIEKAKHEPLIDRATFDRVQLILRTHNQNGNRRRKHTFLLRGIVRCLAHREIRYTAEWHMKKSGLRLGYYHCANRTGCKESPHIKIDDLEKKVSELFRDLRFSKSLIERIIAKARKKFEGERTSYEKQVVSLQNRKNALIARERIAEDKLLAGALPDNAFKRIGDEIQHEIRDIDGQLAKLSEHKQVRVDIAREIIRLTKNIHRAYLEADSNLKKQYLLLFFKAIFVSGAEIKEVKYTELFDELMRLKDLTRIKLRDLPDPGIISHQLGA